MKLKCLLILGLSILIGLGAMRIFNLNAHAQATPPMSKAEKTGSLPVFSDELKGAFDLVDFANIDEIEAKIDDAKRGVELTLKQRQKDLGPEDRLVGESLLTLGLLYLVDLEYVKAEKALKRARAIYEKTYGAESLELSYALAASAEYEMERGTDEHARVWLKRTLALRESALGPEHLEVAKAAFALAEYYQTMREFSAANELYERVMRIRAKLSPGDEDAQHQVLARQACILRKKQKIREAVELEFRAGVGPEPQYEKNGKFKYTRRDSLDGKVRRWARIGYSANPHTIDSFGSLSLAIGPSGRLNYACSNASLVPSVLPFQWERRAYRSLFSPTIENGVPVSAYGYLGTFQPGIQPYAPPPNPFVFGGAAP
jgi:tetratricopeptide (TPR) repeat protein